LFHAKRKTDGHTCMMKLIAALCNFADVLKTYNFFSEKIISDYLYVVLTSYI